MAIDSSSAFSHSEFISQVAALCEEWNAAEEWIKKGEMINQDAVISSINELRYAGRKLADAHAAAARLDGDAARAHLLGAGENLTKARHEVVDSIVGVVLERANEIRGKTGAGNLQKYFPQYGELFGLLKTLAEKTVQSHGDWARRNGIYEEIMERDLPALDKIHGALEASLPAIEQNINADRQKRLIAFIFGAGGFITGIVGFIVGFIK